MQKLNSADNPRLFKDKTQTQSITQYKPSKGDVRVLLEVKVIENENLMDQSEVIEVTIIPPETVDPFVHFPPDSASFKTEKISGLEHHAEAYRRPAVRVTDQCRIPPLDRQLRNSFFAYNLTDDPAINVGEIVGDSPSKVPSKRRIVVPENNVKLRHGDHCDSFISDPEISHAKIGLQTVSTDLLKCNVNFCNSKSKIRDTPPYVNTQVYQVHLEAKAAHPLVELSAAQIILEAYKPDESSRCDAKHQIIEALRKTLSEWGSDERRIADTLYNDCFSLMKCEHCGVISFKKEQILVPRTIGDDFSVKVDTARQPQCRDDEEFLKTGNTVKFYDVSGLNVHDQAPPNQCNENIPRSKFSTPPIENEASKSKLKVQKPGIKKLPENSSQLKVESPRYRPDTKLFLRGPTDAGNIDTPSAMETMTAERDRDSICENMIKMIDVGRKKESKTNILPSVTTNRCGRCLLSVEKNEKSNDPRFRNTYSTRYSPRQGIAKSFKKPVEKTCRDHRIGNNLQTGNNRTKIQGKYSTVLSKDGKQAKAPIHMKNNNVSDTLMTKPKTKTVAKSKTLSVQDSTRKNKVTRPVVPPSNIPTKLERNGRIKPVSSNNAANYMLREKPYAVSRKERALLQIDVEPAAPRKRSLITSKNHESESQSKAHFLSRKNEILHAKLIQENNLTKNIPYCCTASSDDQLSEQDQEDAGAGNNHPSISDNNDRRSFRRSKNHRKFNEIVPNFNYSAPLIGLAKKPFANNDFVIDRYLASSSPPAQYNAESETTAFSSSSSENATREWADSFAHVSRFQYEPLPVKSNDESSCLTTRNIRSQIEKAIKKCSNYSVVASKENTCSHETLTDTENSLKLDQKNALPDLDHITKQYERFRNTDCHYFSDDEAIPSTNYAALPISLQSEDGRRVWGFFKTMDDSKKLLLVDETTKMTTEYGDSAFDTSRNDGQLKVAVNKCRDNGNHDIYTVEEYRSKKSRPEMNTEENIAGKIGGGHSEIRQSQVSFDTSEEIFPEKQKYAAIRTPVSKGFANCKPAINPLKTTYKNPTPVISSSSEYSNEYHLEHGVHQGSLCKEKAESVLQLNKSETFECQITYDEFSSKDISTGSKENMEAKALPVYRKILESKDEMDWETFQQLVGTLHPSQKELFCDICKAVSNEAKRVAGETGAFTEVCIEINPVSTSQALPFDGRRTRLKTFGDEISFEMDMILNDSETFFQETKETLYEPEWCL